MMSFQNSDYKYCISNPFGVWDTYIYYIQGGWHNLYNNITTSVFHNLNNITIFEISLIEYDKIHKYSEEELLDYIRGNYPELLL